MSQKTPAISKLHMLPAAEGTARPRRAWLKSPVCRNRRVLAGSAIVLVLAVLAIFANLIAPSDPTTMHPDLAFQFPGHGGFLLGSDEYGRDVFSRLCFGARISLEVAISSVAIAAGFGVVLGLVAGYYGGWVDWLIMRAADVVLCFPPILLGIAVLAFLGNSMRNLILTIGVLYVMRFVRVVYTSVQVVRHNEYVDAARVVGAPGTHIMRTAILPNVAAPILVQTSLSLGFAVLLEAGLSFLGLGSVPPTPSWGVMLASGRDFMDSAPYLVICPAVAVALAVLAFNFLGDGLRDALDPRLRR